MINFGSVISLLYKYILSHGDVCCQDRPWNFCDAQFGILSFRSKGDEDLRILGPIQLSEKEAKKSLNCPPQKSYPSQPPALSWQRHSLVVSTIFVTSMVVSFFSHLGIAEKTGEVVCWWQNELVGFDLRIKKKHNASRLDLNLGYIFSKQPKKNTAPTSQFLQVLNCGKDFFCTSSQKKTTAWMFQQNSSKIDGHISLGTGFAGEPSQPSSHQNQAFGMGIWAMKKGPFGWLEGISLVGWNTTYHGNPKTMKNEGFRPSIYGS